MRDLLILGSRQSFSGGAKYDLYGKYSIDHTYIKVGTADSHNFEVVPTGGVES